MLYQLALLLQRILSSKLNIFTLFSYEYAYYVKILTETKEVEGKGDRGNTKKAKLIIHLKKSEKFQEIMEKFEKIRAENKKLNGETEENK